MYVRRPADVKKNHSHFFLQKLLGFFVILFLFRILTLGNFVYLLLHFYFRFFCAIFKQFLSSSSVLFFCLFVVIYFSFLSYMLIIYVCMCAHTFTNVYLFNKKWKALLILKKFCKHKKVNILVSGVIYKQRS